jgi:hypothetical protein
MQMAFRHKILVPDFSRHEQTEPVMQITLVPAGFNSRNRVYQGISASERAFIRRGIRKAASQITEVPLKQGRVGNFSCGWIVLR